MDVNRFFETSTTPLSKWDSWKEQNQGKSTPKLYQSGLDYFMAFHGIESYDELLEIHMEATRRGVTDPLSKYIVAEMVRKAVNHRIYNEGKSGQHAKSIKSAVTKFFQLCGFEDFVIKLPRGTNKQNGNGGSDIITPKELETVIGIARELMHKALILLLKDSGLRLGDVLSIDFGDVMTGVDSKMDFFFLKRFTKKTGDRAQTVIGVEALNALRDWIRYRRDRGETITPDTPLFIKARVRDGVKSKQSYQENLERKTNMRLTRNSASNIVSRLFSKAGYNDVTAHGLRKLHSTYLGVGVDRLSEPMIARLQGKVIGDSREAYKVFAPSDLTAAYANNYHQIQMNSREEERKKISKLENELSMLKGLVEKVIGRKGTWDQIRNPTA